MALPQGVATAKHTRVVTPKKVTRPSSAKKVAVQKKPSAFHDQFKPTLPTNFKRDSLDRKRQSRKRVGEQQGGKAYPQARGALLPSGAKESRREHGAQLQKTGIVSTGQVEIVR